MLAACSALALVGVPGAAQQPVFRSATDAVLVNASVTKGRAPVVGLQAADFVPTDNGVAQTLSIASLDTIPIDVTLVFGAARDVGRDQLLRSAIDGDRIWSLLRPEDRLRVIEGGGEVQGGRVLRRLGGPSLLQLSIVPTPGFSLTDSIFLALAWPVDPDRRHLVGAFTDGADSWSTLDPAQLPVIADRADAVLHAVLWSTAEVAPRESSSSSVLLSTVPLDDWRASYRMLDQAVQRTGGALHRIGRDSFQEVLDDFRRSYVLRYTPHGVARAGWHEIGVKVTRPGSLTIRARKGYEG
jgi:hypothetical protein